MNKIGQRVRALRAKLGLTQKQLEARIGFVRNYISLIENGRQPSQRFIRALELVENAPAPHIEHGGVVQDVPFAPASGALYAQAAASHGFEDNGKSGAGMAVSVMPLLSWAQAGATQAWDSAYEQDGFIGLNVRDPRAFAVQIRGDGMAPQFPHGTFAIVYPGFEAKSGDLVIARLKDDTVKFNRLHVDGNRYTFISLNPIYPPLTVEKSKIEKLFPVGGTFQCHL